MSRRSDEEDAEALPFLSFWLDFTLAIGSKNSKRFGVAKLSEKAWRVLVHLMRSPDGASVAEILNACAISHASASRLLTALEKAGYIARGTATDDGRRKVLRLTKEGRNALGKVFHAARSRP